MTPFNLPDTFELSDLISLQNNDLNPAVKTVFGKKSISLALGPAMIYDLDNSGTEVLIVINVGDSDPLILLMKQIPDLSSRSVKEWQQSFGFVFENPDEQTLTRLFGAKFIINPEGRKYLRKLPSVSDDEKAGDSHLNVGTGKALIKGQHADNTVGSITVYESEDQELADHFLVTVTLCSLGAEQTGGLMSLFIGHRLNPSEVK